MKTLKTLFVRMLAGERRQADREANQLARENCGRSGDHFVGGRQEAITKLADALDRLINGETHNDPCF